MLPAVLKVDAKNHASQLARRGEVARREVARILGREFLVIEECADELSGPGEDLRGSGEFACFTILRRSATEAPIKKRALPEEEMPVNLEFQYCPCLLRFALALVYSVTYFRLPLQEVGPICLAGWRGPVV